MHAVPWRSYNYGTSIGPFVLRLLTDSLYPCRSGFAAQVNSSTLLSVIVWGLYLNHTQFICICCYGMDIRRRVRLTCYINKFVFWAHFHFPEYYVFPGITLSYRGPSENVMGFYCNTMPQVYWFPHQAPHCRGALL